MLGVSESREGLAWAEGGGGEYGPPEDREGPLPEVDGGDWETGSPRESQRP